MKHLLWYGGKRMGFELKKWIHAPQFTSCVILVESLTKLSFLICNISSVQSLSHVWLCNPMDHRLPCPSPIPGAYSNSCPSSRWCHPTISSSVVRFSSCLHSFPASGSFPMSQFFTSGKTKLKGLLWEFDELIFVKLCYQFSSAIVAFINFLENNSIKKFSCLSLERR